MGATFLKSAGTDPSGTQMDVAFTNAGIVDLQSGNLTITGDYIQTASGSLDLSLGGTAAGSEYCQLAVSGAASLGGALNVVTVDGFEPAVGDSFQILTAGTVSGKFASTAGLDIGQGLILGLSGTSATLTAQSSDDFQRRVAGQHGPLRRLGDAADHFQ